MVVGWIYEFGGRSLPAKPYDLHLLGRKGCNLAEMAALGLAVPPGFTITTEVCTYFYANGKTYPPDLATQVDAAVAEVERQTGRKFGDAENPLLLSVRSGARASMPGLMDTVLNLGLNDRSVVTLAKSSGDERFAYDSYRRVIQMYSNVVLDVDSYNFEDSLEHYKDAKGYILDTDLKADDWRAVIVEYKAKVEEATGKPFPQEPKDQLWGAIGAVFSSWMNQRAITYRRLNNIPADWGTAVNVQAMVFGNMGETSVTGVAFTRNPSTGENALYGEFLVNAQGEDVVAGIRTPQNITETARKAASSDKPSLESLMPEVFHQFVAATKLLEKHYKDMQAIEFTVEQGRLYVLQSVNGERTAKAALNIAVSLADEGIITKEEAVKRVHPSALQQLLRPIVDPSFPRDVIARGLPGSPGAASGRICLSSTDAEEFAAPGEPVILVVTQLNPEDLPGLKASHGIVATRGGMTSHAAVVARGLNLPCVTEADEIKCNPQDQMLSVGNREFRAGAPITVDGFAGEVLAGTAPIIEPRMSGELASLVTWADQIAGDVGAVVRDAESAGRAAAWGRRKIVISAIECLLRQNAGMQALLQSIAAEERAAIRESFSVASRLISDSIVALVREAKADDVCVIVGEAIPREQRVGPRGAGLYGRGSLVLQPDFVFMQLAAVYDAIDQLVGKSPGSEFAVAIANVFHQSDIALFQKWSNELAQRRGSASTKNVTLAGVIDSPHSLSLLWR